MTRYRIAFFLLAGSMLVGFRALVPSWLHWLVVMVSVAIIVGIAYCLAILQEKGWRKP